MMYILKFFFLAALSLLFVNCKNRLSSEEEQKLQREVAVAQISKKIASHYLLLENERELSKFTNDQDFLYHEAMVERIQFYVDEDYPHGRLIIDWHSEGFESVDFSEEYNFSDVRKTSLQPRVYIDEMFQQKSD